MSLRKNFLNRYNIRMVLEIGFLKNNSVLTLEIHARLLRD